MPIDPDRERSPGLGDSLFYAPAEIPWWHGFAGGGETNPVDILLEGIEDEDRKRGGLESVGDADANAKALFCIHHPMMESFAALSFRPQLWVAGYPNFEHGPGIAPAMMDADEEVRPQVLSMRAWGAQTDSGEWDYTTRPEDSRARGGTVHGGILFTPPHFEVEDFYGINSAVDVTTLSTAGYVMAAPNVGFALGTPNNDGGVDAKTVVIRSDTSDNRRLIISQVNASRVVTGLLDAELDQGTGEQVVRVLGTGALGLPKGTTAQRPSTLSVNGVRINTDFDPTYDTIEYYDSMAASWRAVYNEAQLVANFLKLDGSNMMLGDLDMGSNKIVSLASGTASGEAVQFGQFIQTSAGAGDAGKPIKLDANGHVDATMVNDADIDHTAIANIGTNSHAAIDTHIADSTIHFTEGSIDHGSIAGLTDDDHTQYTLANGTRAFTGNTDHGGNRVTNIGSAIAAGDALELLQSISLFAALTGATLVGDYTFNDNVKVTLGTGGDADLYYNGTDVVLNPKVVGSGDVRILGDFRIEGNLGVDVDPGSTCKVEIEDFAGAESVLLKCTADDSGPYGIVVGNDTFSTTDTDGLALWVDNSGEANVEAIGTGASFQFRCAGADVMAIDTSGDVWIDDTLAVGQAAASDASAALEVESTAKGFLPPRMTTTQMNNISSPAEGLVIYNTTQGKLYVNADDGGGGTEWQEITSAVP